MKIYDYLTIDESLQLIQRNINAIDSYHLSAKRVLENLIETGSIKALFKFNGFLTSYKYQNFKGGNGSIEIKQISKIKGYFHEISSIYPSEFSTYVFCSNLDEISYVIERAVPHEIISNEFIAANYAFWEVKNDILEKHYAKETYNEVFSIELGEPVSLFNTMPIINKDFSVDEQREPIKITSREIYFKTNDIEQLINSLPKSQSQNDIERQLKDAQAKIVELENQLEHNEAKLAVNDKSLNPKDSAYHLIAILKDLLLNPDIGAYHFNTDTNKSTNQPTQAGLSEYIESLGIRGLKARNVNGILSEANKILNDVQKG